MRISALLLAATLLAPLPALAQETAQERTDRTLIVSFIEDNLSGAGRQVILRGFSGALSSRATADELTIADDMGVWLKLEDIVLDWDRGALFSGVVKVNELSAKTITLTRLPQAGDQPPTPEAGGFHLPELPVAVDIAKIEAATVLLGQDILGEEATATLSAGLTLNGTNAAARLDLKRTDAGPREDIALDMAFDDQTARIDLAAVEDAGGLLSKMLGLPGAPAIDLTAKGQGPIDDFVTTLALTTDGTRRLVGTVAIKGQADLGTAFSADLAGDMAPLFAPQFANFFGQDLRFVAAGQRAATGALILDQFDLQTRSLTLQGSAQIAADGLPERFALTGRLADPSGASVILPTPDKDVSVAAANLDLSFDTAIGDRWTGRFVAQGVKTAAQSAGTLDLSGTGTIQRDATGGLGGSRVAGRIDLTGGDLTFSDTGLAQSIGTEATLTSSFIWAQGSGRINLSSISLTAGDLTLTAAGNLQGLDTGYAMDGTAAMSAKDLSRFSTLAGRPLSGAAQAELSGKGSLLGGDFDLTAQIKGNDLGIGQPQADAVLAGASQINLTAKRDQTGLSLSGVQVTTPALSAQGSAQIGSQQSQARVALTVVDLAQVMPDLGGRLTADLELTGPLVTGAASITGTATATDLAMGTPQIDRALAGETGLTLALDLIDGGLNLRTVTVDARGGTATLAGRVRGQNIDLTLDSTLPDLGIFQEGLGGRLLGKTTVKGDLSGPDLTVSTDVTGKDLRIGTPEVDPLLAGDNRLQATGRLQGTVLTLTQSELSLASGTYSVTGRLDPSNANLSLQAAIPDLGKLRPGFGGALDATGTVTGDLLAMTLAVTATATANDVTTGIAEADKALAGQVTLLTEANLAQSDLILQRATLTSAAGELSAKGHLSAETVDLVIGFTLPALDRLAEAVKGQADGTLRLSGPFQDLGLSLDATTQGLRLGQAQADALLAGRSTLAAKAQLTAGQLRLQELNFVAPHLSAQVNGDLGGPRRKLTLAAQLNDTALLMAEFPGRLTLKGTAEEQTSGYAIDISLLGPGGIDAKVAGTLGANLRTADLRINGRAQAGLANPFLGNRVLAGGVTADLRLSGAISATSLSGRINLQNGRLADPALPFTVLGLSAEAGLSGGAVSVDASANISTGGALRARGSLGLTAPFRSDLSVTALAAVIRDPKLYETRANADLRLTGPLLGGGAALTGRVALAETEVRIASTGLGSAADLPGLRHVNEPLPVAQTRKRAGLIADATTAANAASAPIALDITLSAPNRLFLRGRGLDAELGGELIVAGTTQNVIPSGQFNLIRGRLDVLGRRLDLNSASLSLQGSFDPTVSLSASTKNDDVTTTISIEGPASEPVVSFSSSPELPEEEIVAQLIFGKRLQSLSPFQALQLANAVATLAGRGGDGISSKLRQGFGLDNLDVQTTDDGNTQLTAGKYLSEKLYTEVTVDQGGKTRIDLNLDLTDTLTVKGRAGNDGNTGIGLFFEKDY